MKLGWGVGDAFFTEAALHRHGSLHTMYSISIRCHGIHSTFTRCTPSTSAVVVYTARSHNVLHQHPLSLYTKRATDQNTKPLTHETALHVQCAWHDVKCTTLHVQRTITTRTRRPTRMVNVMKHSCCRGCPVQTRTGSKIRAEEL